VRQTRQLPSPKIIKHVDHSQNVLKLKRGRKGWRKAEYSGKKTEYYYEIEYKLWIRGLILFYFH
jgi:hypothetical protein